MRRYLPIVVLTVLSPLVAEVIFGATPISNLGALLPVVPAYGGGAVLIRELARRRGAGWGRIAWLGTAYAIIEEGLVLQSMFHPTLFNAAGYGGRAFGVNWVWSEWTVGYHIVWSIVVPILLTELLFPPRRTQPWLGRVGVAVAGVFYALGVLALAAIYRLFLTPDFRTPVVLAAGAVLLVVVLVALALGWPALPVMASTAEMEHPAPSPWLVGLVALLGTSAWFLLFNLPAWLRTGVLVLVPMLAELALAAGVIALIRRWSAGRGWSDRHRLAVAVGAILTSMWVGFFGVTAGNPIDQLGQGIISVVVMVLLALFAWRLQQRHRVTVKSSQAMPGP